jgi:hypothetical protein
MPQLLYPEGFGERDEIEAAERGYLSHVRVELDDGRRFAVFFIEPVRLRQEVEALAAQSLCFAEVGLIVLPEVTRESIELAVADLIRRGFFEYFRPLTPEDLPWNI